VRRCLPAAPHLQLGKDAVDVILHCRMPDSQNVRDLFVRQSLFYERNNLALAPR
jgi:hypothetical protein